MGFEIKAKRILKMCPPEREIPIHGGEPERDIQRLNLHINHDILDFSVNISPFGLPKQLCSGWEELIKTVQHYPSPEGKGLIPFLQKKFHLHRENILPGNGSTELIYLVPSALNLKKVAIIAPSFSDYSRASLLAGAEIIPFSLSAEKEFSAPTDKELEDILSQADALFIGNPNNPTGTCYPNTLLIRLAKDFPDKWLLVDEAFMPFLDDPERVSLIKFISIPNIIVFLSLTKFYALPGLRIGCVTAHKGLIDHLRIHKIPWSVNSVAEKAVEYLFDCQDYEVDLKRLMKKERIRLYQLLKEMDGIRVFQPTANYILGQWLKTENLDDLMKYLLEAGIYIRDCRNFKGLEENYFRIAIRLPDENDRLLHAFKYGPSV